MQIFLPASLRIACCIAAATGSHLLAADQPQWGQAWSRNMVSSETNLPASFDPKTRQSLKWIAKLGTETHSTPIVAGGRVYVGTNNGEPRDPKHQGDRGVLMCFDEATGRLLWQLVVPKRAEDPYFDWPKTGIASPVTVAGDRVYLVSNRGEVICLDARGMANGNDGPFLDEAAHMTPPTDSAPPPKYVIGADISPEPLRPPADGKLLPPGSTDADILWAFDLVAAAGIWPHDGAHSSVLIHGDYLYVNTGTGVDNTHKRIRRPDAPSLVVLDRHTGRLVARDAEGIGPQIFHATWSSPSLAEVGGRPLVFFAGGNGIVYAFEPLGSRRGHEAELPIARQDRSLTAAATNDVAKLKKVFQFDFDPSAPKTDVHKFNTNRREGPSNIYGMPVFHQGRLYVAGGGDIWWGKNEAWLKCIDATNMGDITTNRLMLSHHMANHGMVTPAVSDGLVFSADCGRKFHCVDAISGQAQWTHDLKGEVWASPYVADGKVYLGTRSGNFYVFAASREKKVLAELELGNPISATATAANGVLYVATMTELFAVQMRPPAE